MGPFGRRSVAWIGLAAGSLLLAPLTRPQSETPTFGTTVVVPFGLRGLIYFLPPRTGRLPAFGKLDAVGQIYTSTLNVSPRAFEQGFPGVTDRFEWFAIDYWGRFWIDEPGRYDFSLTSDDGARLYIDSRLAINDDGVHSPRTMAASLDLAGGIHRIRLSYFQGPRSYLALVLSLAGPDGKWQLFSTDRFKPPADPEKWKYANQNDFTPATPPTNDFEVTGKPQKAFAAGLAAMADGDWKGAKKRLQRAVKLAPNYAEAWAALGKIWTAESNQDKAREAYEKALAANPACFIAVVRLAQMDLAKGRDEEVLQITHRAMEFEPVNPWVYFYSAVADVHLRRREEGEKTLRQAIAADMAHEIPPAEHLLGTLLDKKGDTQGAIEHLKKYLELAPHAGDAGQVQTRIDVLEQSLKIK